MARVGGFAHDEVLLNRAGFVGPDFWDPRRMRVSLGLVAGECIWEYGGRP